jgi:hypothetical protein
MGLYKGHKTKENKSVEKYSQDPVLFKPTIYDVVHGGKLERVFSKTIAFKTQELSCSSGIFVPRAFLGFFDKRERKRALQMIDQGLFIVTLYSASSYFSKTYQEELKSISTYVPSDPTRLIQSPKRMNATGK